MGDLEWPAPSTKAMTTNDIRAKEPRGCLCPPSPSSFPQKVKKTHKNIKEASIITSWVYFPSSGRKWKAVWVLHWHYEVYQWRFLMALICQPLLPWAGARELKGLESTKFLVPRVTEQGHSCLRHLWLCAASKHTLPVNLLSFPSNWFPVFCTGNCF